MTFDIKGEAVTGAQWMAPAVAPESAVTILAPAVWGQAPAPPAVTVQTPPMLPPQAPLQHPAQAILPPAVPPSPPACFVPGMTVVLQGLANSAEFNGLPGIVASFDPDCGRYNVMIEME